MSVIVLAWSALRSRRLDACDSILTEQASATASAEQSTHATLRAR